MKKFKQFLVLEAKKYHPHNNNIDLFKIGDPIN